MKDVGLREVAQRMHLKTNSVYKCANRTRTLLEK
jgi:predicted DNA-binding protein YlxM (UPF0122 family)